MPSNANVKPATIYREAALRRLSSPRQLNHYLSVASPSNWLVLMAILVLLGATAAWSWNGAVTQTAAGQGILVGAAGLVSVNAPGGGQIVTVSVKPGDQVRAGQSIASIGNPVLAEQVRLARMALADAERAAERDLSLRSETTAFQLRAQDTQRENLEREIAGLEQQTAFAAEQVENQVKLYQEGLGTKSALVASQERLAGIRADIARHRTQIEQLRAERVSAQAGEARASSEGRARVAEFERRLAALREELRQTTSATTPCAGRIIETKIYPGAMVTAGTPLVTMQPDGDKLEAVVYVSSQQAKFVAPGMDVQLSPGNTRPEEHGYLRATVLAVASFPVSPLAVTRKLENEALTSAMTGSGPVTEIRVALRRDPTDAGGYQWSSRRDVRVAVSGGTLCTARIVIAKQRPIMLAVPAVKEALGLN
jgi:HlyD family secretion protein